MLIPHVATTQFSPELNSLDWGGSIINKLYHTTTTPPPPPPPPCDYFLDQYREVYSNVVWYGVAQCNLGLFGLVWDGYVGYGMVRLCLVL